MNLRNEIELTNTRTKLARLEARYAAHENESGGDEELREMTMESLKRLINQLKEEIARYEAGIRGAHDGLDRRRLRNDHEVANTRGKLARLEALYSADEKKSGGDEELRDMEMDSLKRDINQFKEEIARYEAHQPVRR